jgi:hypothetical protein
MTKIQLRKAREKYERNLAMAERFSHNPAFEEKFLSQAIDAETEINRLNKEGWK